MGLLIENLLIWDGREKVVDGALLITDGRIEKVFTRDEPGGAPPAGVTERLDGGGRLAIPGLVIGHTHLYSSLARGMALSGFDPTSFTEILEQLWWRLDRALDDRSVWTSALIGAMEAARCGATTLIDHHASPSAIPGSLDRVRDAVCNEVGLRGSLCYEVSDRDGEAAREQGIAENLRFLDEAGGDGGQCSALFGLHASFTLSDETLGRIAERIPDGAGVHIHVAEGPEDETSCVDQHGCRVVERLDRFGFLRPNSILVHCLHLDEGEKDLVQERGSIVIHNPRSNMNNAVGVFDLPGFVDRGIRVGLGTDGLGANLLSELFTAALLQKATRANALAAPFPTLYALLFQNNPKIVETLFGVKVGRIAPGYAADIAILDYTPPTPLSGGNALGHLLFGLAVHSMRVSDLLVAGRRIMHDGRFVDLDEKKIYADAREEAKGLWQRAEAIHARKG